MYVVHAATRRIAQTPGTGLAPGSLCVVNVTGLYQAAGPLAWDDPVTLRFRAPGEVEAREMTVLATNAFPGGVPSEFTALIPAGTAAGQGEVIAIAGSGRRFSAEAWIAPSNFGIFTKAGAGYGAVAAQVWREAPVTVGLTTPARAGEWVTLWGTGLGAADGAGITVEVGGIRVMPSYAGAAPGLPGVDQINFQFPEGVPADCYVPVVVNAGGQVSNMPSVAAADGPGACHHRLGLSADTLTALDQGATVPLSQSWVHGDVIPTVEDATLFRRYDTASLDFLLYDAPGVQVVTGLLSPRTAGCRLEAGGAAGAFLYVSPIESGTPVVTGPGGARITMDGSFGHYTTAPEETTYKADAIPPARFAGGGWSVEVPAGKDVAGFQAVLRTAPALRWTNRASVSPVSRVDDLVLKWDPSGYSGEWMQGSIGVGASAVICQAPATAGSITIPSSLIAQLPAVATTSTGRPMVELLLTPGDGGPTLYQVPLVGGGSFQGVATFSDLEMVWADFR